MTVTTKTLTEWREIHDYAPWAGWVFRGQREASWDLRSSIERCFARHDIPAAERFAAEERLIREFRRIYHQYDVHIPHKDSFFEWLALMQHHGAPTRLLDFTYSIYVAAYFATEDAEGDCAIWAVDAPWLLDQAMTILSMGGKPSEATERMFQRFTEDDEKIVAPLCFSKPDICSVFPMRTFRLNERLRIQHGTFLVPSDVSQSFINNMAAIPMAKDKFLKLVIPKRLVADARRELFSMSISRTSLFPGLDGYAQSLGIYSPAIKPHFEWTDAKTLGTKSH